MSSILDVCHDMEKEKMTVQLATPADRQTAADMLSSHHTGVPGKFPADFLPETGIVVRDHSGMVCVIPVYLEQSSSVAVLGHFIADSKVPRKKLREAAFLAIEGAKRFAKSAGKKHLISLFGRNSINRIADGCGFQNADSVQEKIIYLN